MKPLTQAISCFLCCLLTMLTLCGCQTEAANNNDNQDDKKLLGEPISARDNQGDEPFTLEQTGMTNQVPSSYLSAAAQGGTVREIKYHSKDYAGNGGDITKQAFVYLPYGYDEADADTRYNILYALSFLLRIVRF